MKPRFPPRRRRLLDTTLGLLLLGVLAVGLVMGLVHLVGWMSDLVMSLFR